MMRTREVKVQPANYTKVVAAIFVCTFTSGVVLGAAVLTLLASWREQSVVVEPSVVVMEPAGTPVAAPVVSSMALRRTPKSRGRGTLFVGPGHVLYPTAEFLAANRLQGPTSTSRAEQAELDAFAAQCIHPSMDRSGTNGHKLRFKCVECRTIWSGSGIATEDD